VNIGQEVLNTLKDEITELEYNRYIRHLTYDAKKSTATQALFYAPNALVLNWIKNKYTDKIAHIFEVKTGTKVSVQITLKNAVEKLRREKAKRPLQRSNRQAHCLTLPTHLRTLWSVEATSLPLQQ